MRNSLRGMNSKGWNRFTRSKTSKQCWFVEEGHQNEFFFLWRRGSGEKRRSREVFFRWWFHYENELFPACEKKAIRHRRALEIILIFANCSIIMDVLEWRNLHLKWNSNSFYLTALISSSCRLEYNPIKGWSVQLRPLLVRTRFQLSWNNCLSKQNTRRSRTFDAKIPDKQHSIRFLLSQQVSRTAMGL